MQSGSRCAAADARTSRLSMRAPSAKSPTAAAMTAVGRALFFDPSLSASGKMACATLPRSRARICGRRTTGRCSAAAAMGAQRACAPCPSLMYTQNMPAFTEHYFDDDGDDSIDQGPAGGRTWDGRAQSAHEQARLPSVFAVRNGECRASMPVLTKVRARELCAAVSRGVRREGVRGHGRWHSKAC